MTDKQIIDVCPYQGECSISGCKRNDDGCFVRQLFEERNRAENRIVELNKSIQAKEQECEELRQYHNKCCEEFEKEKKEWLEKYNQVSRDFYSGKYCNAEKCQQLDQLKAENDELKFQNKRLDEVATYWHKSIFKVERNERKLKQTLTELGTILTHCMQQDICTTCDYSEECNLGDEEIPTYDICKFLLNKINQHQ